MPVQDLPAKTAAPRTFRNSLTRTVVITLLLLSILPAALTTSLTFFRARALLQQQVSQQLQTIVETYSQQLTELSGQKQTLLSSVMENSLNQQDLDTLLDPTAQDIVVNVARMRLSTQMTSVSNAGGLRNFDQIAILDSDGLVISATDERWFGQNFKDTPGFGQAMNVSGATLAFDPQGLYPGEMLVMVSQKLTSQSNGRSATIIGVAKETLLTSLLASSSSFFDRGEAYYFTNTNQLIGLTSDKKAIIPFNPDPDQQEQLVKLRSTSASQGSVITSRQRPVLAYAQWIPSLRANLVVAVPVEVTLGYIRSLIPLSIALLVLSLVVSGFVLYTGTTRLVNPLVQLANRARDYARGEWSQRVEVKRDDEIGMLANAFNQMGQELSALYRSLEGKVEERTRQLRTASEVAQVATSVTDRQEMIRRTVELVTERFDYHYAAVYLLDETGNFAIMQEVASVSEEAPRLKGMRIPVSSKNAVGHVALSNEPLVTADTSEEPSVQGRTLLSRTRSQAIIPIAIGSQVYGVLDVQSSHPHSFDPESVVVLQNLAGQIGIGLRNSLLLASTQVNLEETTLLARMSRQITQARSRDEVLSILNEALSHTAYISMVLSVYKDALKVVSLSDSRGYSIDSGLKGIQVPFNRAVEILSEGTTQIANEMKGPVEFENLFALMTRRDCRAAATLPIIENGQATYLVVLGTRERKELSHTGLQAFSTLAEIAGTSLERFSVMETLQHRLVELETLKTVGETISSEPDLSFLFEILQQEISEHLGADLTFGVALYHPQQNQVEFPYLSNGSERLRQDPVQLGEGLTSYVISQRKPLILVQDTEEAARKLGVRMIGSPARSWMGVPLIAGGELLGALVVQDKEHEGRFTEEDLRLLETLCPQVAGAIRTSRLLAEMQRAVQSFEQERFLLNTLLENIPEQIYFKDRDGQYQRVSRSFVDHNSLEQAADAIGKTDAELFGAETGMALYEQDQQIILSGQAEISRMEKEENPEGDFWSLNTRIPLVENGTTIGLLGIAQNVTDLKKAEQMIEQRAHHLQTAAEVARDTTGTLQVDELLSRAVELIRARFGYYHASIFLLDALNQYAILSESSGEVGQRMKQTGHRLAVGSQSLVGQATSTSQPVVVNNVKRDPHYYPNPLLPDTSSEAVIPLMAGEQVIGALDVQSIHVDAFSEDDIHTLQILADQLAVAVVNANLFVKMEEHLSKHRLLHHITSAATAAGDLDGALSAIVEGLRTALSGDRIAIYFPTEEGGYEVRALAGYPNEYQPQVVQPGEGLIGQVAAEKRPIRVQDTQSDSRFQALDQQMRSAIAVPILFGEQLQGAMLIESSQPAAFDENDQEILGTLGNSLGAVIANVGLIARVRQQTERQKMLFEITSKIRRSVDVETILRTSATELARALEVQQARIEITAGKTPEEPMVEISTHNNGHHGKENLQ